MLENEKEGAKKFDNSELLRKANIDREEYYAELDKERQREQQKLIADKEFEERKQREILDLEDQVNALISKNRFFEKEMRSLLLNGDEGDNQIIEKYKDKISQNEYEIYQLRCSIDEVRYSKRPE